MFLVSVGVTRSRCGANIFTEPNKHAFHKLCLKVAANTSARLALVIDPIRQSQRKQRCALCTWKAARVANSGEVLPQGLLSRSHLTTQTQTPIIEDKPILLWASQPPGLAALVWANFIRDWSRRIDRPLPLCSRACFRVTAWIMEYCARYSSPPRQLLSGNYISYTLYVGRNVHKA